MSKHEVLWYILIVSIASIFFLAVFKVKQEITSVDKLDKEKKIARLLALSLAQSHGNAVSSSLRTSIKILNEDVFSSKHKLLLNYANELYNQAEILINSEFKQFQEQEESRSQPRIALSTNININILNSHKTYKGKLVDISWGGAQIKTKELLASENDIIEIIIPYTQDNLIRIQGSVIRYWTKEDIFYSAIRFTKLHYKDELRFNKLLELFFENKGADKRHEHTQFSHHIDISYWDTDEIRSNLSDISEGKMNIVMPDLIDIGKSICVHIEGPDNYVELNLRAHITKQEETFLAEFPMYRMELEFDHPKEEVNAIFRNMIQKIMERDKENQLKFENDIKIAKKLLNE